MNIQKGYKLVPVEPTEEMNEAGCQAYMAADGSAWFMHRSSMGAAYRAMLAAAPTTSQPIYDEPADIAELRAELNLAKRYLRQTLAALNPRSRLSCDIRRLIGMNPIGAKSVGDPQ